MMEDAKVEMSNWSAKVAIVGCGNIAPRYAVGMGRFKNLEIVGCADVEPSRAIELAQRYGIYAYDSVEDLLIDPGIDIVVNLTPPIFHHEVTRKILDAGKNVYVEKPVTATLAEAQEIVGMLKPGGPRLGCAPDTFLGSAAQTVRWAVDEGLIGEPIGMIGFIGHSRAELWHPDPTWLFRPGGGPALDLGPYYLNVFVNALGPIAEVEGLTRIGSPVRKVHTPGRRVDSIEVTVPSHEVALFRFVNGVIGSMQMSFDVWHGDLPFGQIYGTEGALNIADPNGFDGDVTFKGNLNDEWRVVEPVIMKSGREDTDEQMLRGFGVADLANSLFGGTQRATVELAYHVLEILDAVEVSSREHQLVGIESTVERPAPLRDGEYPFTPLA